LDVHPPHEPIHTWRDFLLHLLTITVGLLIALGLEAMVENLHHRHIVEVARQNIRHEITENNARGAKDIASIKVNSDNVKGNMKRVRDLRTNKHALDNGEMHFDFSWDSFQESAWLSARDSGALTYMPASEVQSYADLYNQQELVEKRATSIFIQETQLLADLVMEQDPADLSPEDVHALLHGAAITYIDLFTLNQLIEQLDKSYTDTLKK
jgi:hypothetical protein